MQIEHLFHLVKLAFKDSSTDQCHLGSAGPRNPGYLPGHFPVGGLPVVLPLTRDHPLRMGAGLIETDHPRHLPGTGDQTPPTPCAQAETRSTSRTVSRMQPRVIKHLAESAKARFEVPEGIAGDAFLEPVAKNRSFLAKKGVLDISSDHQVNALQTFLDRREIGGLEIVQVRGRDRVDQELISSPETASQGLQKPCPTVRGSATAKPHEDAPGPRIQCGGDELPHRK